MKLEKDSRKPMQPKENQKETKGKPGKSIENRRKATGQLI
jgi:hypothetical protein